MLYLKKKLYLCTQKHSNMKKYISLALMLLVVSAAIAGPRPRKNSRTEMGIHGDAIYVIEYTYNLRGGRDGGRQLICIDSITFDKRGNLQDKFRTKANDYTWYSYYFDVNGYSLGWNEYNRDKMLTVRTAYHNDRDGNRIERTVFLGNQMTKREASKFVNGLKTAEQSFDPDGEMTEKRTYKYDAKGNCTEMEFYNRDGELMQHYLYKYDQHGNRIEWRFYDADEFLSALTNTSTGNTAMSTSTTRMTTGCARPSTATMCPIRSLNARLLSPLIDLQNGSSNIKKVLPCRSTFFYYP